YHAPCSNHPTTVNNPGYHDENDNKKLDRNIIGIPQEGFGFSNNPSLGFDLPEEEEIRFKAKQTGIDLRISVVYL
ncbi:MAG: DUF2141 domain-containing protein, partial [Proteobacteria bacterium]|nr:DUF2141 domain-containing protein [Pseudomonadota bacterium]